MLPRRLETLTLCGDNIGQKYTLSGDSIAKKDTLSGDSIAKKDTLSGDSISNKDTHIATKGVLLGNTDWTVLPQKIPLIGIV